MNAQPETPPSSPETPPTWTLTPDYSPLPSPNYSPVSSPEWIYTPDPSPEPSPLPSPEPTPPPSPVGGVSVPYTFQGYIDQALLDDIEEFANLGWLNGRVLDMVVNEESDSEPLA